jgi:hypothetical protein
MALPPHLVTSGRKRPEPTAIGLARSAAKLLSKDEARRIAANVEKLRE